MSRISVTTFDDRTSDTIKLDALQQQFVSEIRRYDDESARRTDELLARVRAERDGRVS